MCLPMTPVRCNINEIRGEAEQRLRYAVSALRGGAEMDQFTYTHSQLFNTSRKYMVTPMPRAAEGEQC